MLGQCEEVWNYFKELTDFLRLTMELGYTDLTIKGFTKQSTRIFLQR